MSILKHLLPAVVGLAVALPAQAALINLVKPAAGNPSYADFSTYSLNVYYDYSGTTGPTASGTSVFEVFNTYNSGSVVPAGEAYEARARPSGAANASFNGSYYLRANISVNSGAVSLTSGYFNVYGNLGGGTTGDLLLSGNLLTGPGNFGYVDPSGAAAVGKYDLFEFVYSVSGGREDILRDFFGVGQMGGIILDANFDATGPSYDANNGSRQTTAKVTTTVPPYFNPTTYQGFDGYWTHDFANPLGLGFAGTFVPEPAAYPIAAGVLGLLTTAAARLRNRGLPPASRRR